MVGWADSCNYYLPVIDFLVNFSAVEDVESTAYKVCLM